MAAGMATGSVCFITALLMIMHGAVLGVISRRGVLMLFMSVTLGGMSVGTGDHRRKCCHALQRQGNQQYRNQKCA